VTGEKTFPCSSKKGKGKKEEKKKKKIRSVEFSSSVPFSLAREKKIAEPRR